MHPVNFQAYSEYYDVLYSDKDYKAEAEYVLGLLNRDTAGGSMLELGCGTGAHAELFAERGWNVHGIDLSPWMLERAHQRAAASPYSGQLKFEQGDVRTFRANTRFDAVVSLFHVTSYQTTNADVEAMFETAAAHLKPGGVFLFDFWYGPAVLSERPTVRVKRCSNDRVAITRIAEPILEEDKNVVEVRYSISVKQGREAPVEIFEEHRMRYWFLPELEALLRWKGMAPFETLAWLSESGPSMQSWSACISAVKR